MPLSLLLCFIEAERLVNKVASKVLDIQNLSVEFDSKTILDKLSFSVEAKQ